MTISPITMRPIESILADYRATLAAVREEERRREAVMESNEYKALQDAMDAMLEGIPDSSEEHALDKAELIAYMQENGVRQVEEFKAKGRTVRTVDTYQLLRKLEGDIDALMVICSVKQKDLTEFIKANDRKDLKACVKDEGFRINDIVLVNE